MNARAMDPGAGAKLLVLGEGGPLDRSAFWNRVRTLGDALAARPERRWALVCEDSAWFAAGLMALAGRGRSVVLPPAPQAGSLAASGAGVEAVLTDRPESFPGYALLPAAEAYSGVSGAPRLPDDAARIEFYTSGSSGAPKCVP